MWPSVDSLPAKAAGPPVTFQMSKGIKLDPPALPLSRHPSDSREPFLWSVDRQCSGGFLGPCSVRDIFVLWGGSWV